DAMAGVFRGEALAGKDMPEVAATVVAEDFRPAAIGIALPAHSPRDFVVKTGPAAAGVKFVLRFIQRGFTTAADVYPCGLVIVVFTGKGPFRALVFNNVFLFFSKLVPVFCIFHSEVG